MYQFVIAQPHSLLVLSLTVTDPLWLGWQQLSQIVEYVWNIDNCHVVPAKYEPKYYLTSRNISHPRIVAALAVV